MAFTPLARQLRQRLEDRRAWFRNWLFQWHQLKIPGGRVEVDLFNGRTSYLGGIEFSGSARDVYWDAITRGVRKEVIDQFAWADEQARRYNRDSALESIDQAAGLLISFVREIRREAVERDRILRGDGINFPATSDQGFWDGVSAEEIQNSAEAIKKALPHDTPMSLHPPTASPPGPIHWLNELSDKNRWWIAFIGLASAIVTFAALFG